MKNGGFFRYKIFSFLIAGVITIAGLGACAPIKEISETTDKIMQDVPTVQNTLTSVLEINKAMYEAMSRGETSLTFNAADIGEYELQHIGMNLSTFWGRPVRYSINNSFKGLDGIIPGRTASVRNITNHFELSSNFYVYDYIKNGVPIPADKTHAIEIARRLPGIAEAIFSDTEATDYYQTLAVHDWLVANIDYDDSIPGISEENGSYGALVLRRTMCQGYAEALELLLKCYTNVETTQIVGEALNFQNEPVPSFESDNHEEGAALNAAAPESPTGDQQDEAGSGWGGHAWNVVRIDGAWYQIDATFNDPKGNPANLVSHFYFGQTDEVMSQNHRWEAEYFPVSDTENFLFFRRSELFAEGWDSFEAMLSGMLTESPIDRIEIAIQGARIDEENIQFIYRIRRDIEETRWREQYWNDICVTFIEFIYN